MFPVLRAIFRKWESLLVYIFLFLLPLQTRFIFHYGMLNGGGWEYGTYSLYVIELIILALGVAALRYGKAAIWSRTWLGIAGVLDICVLVAAYFAPDWRLAVYGYAVFALAGVAGYALAVIPYDRASAWLALGAGGTVQAVLGWWQFANQRVLASTALGIAGQYPESVGVAVVETQLRRWLRAYGGLPHPNVAGGYLVITALCTLGAYLAIRQRMASAQTDRDARRYAAMVVGLWLMLLIQAAGIFVTFSRSAWIGLIVGIAVCLGGLLCQRQWGKSVQVMAAAAAMAAVMVLLGVTFSEPTLARLTGEGRLEQRSLSERIDSLGESRKIIFSNPLGVGKNNYGLSVHDRIRPDGISYTYQPVHVTWLLVAAEAGWLGGLAFAVLMALLVALAVRTQPIMGGLAVGSIAMMSFDHWWWSLPVGMFVVAAVIGLTLHGRVLTEDTE